MRASPILSALPEADQKVLSQRFKPRAFADGQRVIAEGQPPGAVYVLLRGVCLATHASGKRYPDLREGDLFGEVSVLTEGPATATVTTAGPVLTLELPGEQFKALVLANPAAAQAVNVLAGERLTRTAKFDQADRRV
jgi:CRP-like cAMP-binding protein